MTTNLPVYKINLNMFPFHTLNNAELQSLFNSCELMNIFYNKLLPFSSLSNCALKLLYEHDYSQYIDPPDVQKSLKTKNKISILNINIRSLNKNFEKLEILISQLNFRPTIISVNETWLEKDKPFLYSLQGYDFLSKPGTCRAGGTSIFIKSEINYKLLEHFNMNLTNCEDLWIEVTLSFNNKFIFGSIYRHPTYNITDFQDKLIKNIEKLNYKRNKFFLSGDFNINYLNDSNMVEQYKNEIQSHGTLQLVKTPTHFSHTNNTIIDHIYTNIPENKTLTKCIAFEVSDHIPVISVIGEFRTNKNKIEKRKIRDLKNFKPEEFTKELGNSIAQLNFDSEDVNELWNSFRKSFNGILNKHAPQRLQTRKESRINSKPYLTKGILKSIKTKQKLFKKTIIEPTEENWNYFKLYRNNLTRAIKESKKAYYKNQVKTNRQNPKKLWNILNNITNLKSKKQINNINLSLTPEEIITDPITIANTFNHYFTTVGTNLSNKIKMPEQDGLNRLKTVKKIPQSMFLNYITELEVLTYIKQLNPNKATRSDCIPTKYIKLSAEVIAPALTLIFNKCIEKGVFPEDLKIAEVIPIFKKGDKTKLNNHRPISKLSPFSKIFERHLHTELTKFINKHNILHPHQYGFRQNSSTEQAITQITQEISTNIQNKYYTCSIFLDLAKAFDTIDHKILISKLYNYGIRGLPAKLLINYLTNRSQRTKINNYYSNFENITCGIPQGSILGPLLFNLYINDLPNVSDFSVRLFADDACLNLKNKNPDKLEAEVNKQLTKISNWTKINKLSINHSKSKVIIFNRINNTKKFEIKMDEQILERVTNIKYLGVHLDEKLNWKIHIKKVQAKLSTASYILSKTRHYVPQSTLKLLYYSLAYSNFNYCITAYGGTYKTNLNPIIILQKRIIRIITHNKFDAPSKPIFLTLKLLPFQYVYRLNILILMYKIKNNLITGSYNLSQIQQTHNYSTRLSQQDNFYQNFNRTDIGQATSSAQGVKLWREIPTELKSFPLHIFKTKLKHYLINLFRQENN